jgi:predicted DNA-binding protein (MmcQ/YjbR family)
MNVETLQQFALALPGTSNSLPFDDKTLVFKVLDKMFLTIALEAQPLCFNFKALPADNIRYREAYSAVEPGYHSNKKHWSTVRVNGSIPERELKEWIVNSYKLVVTNMTKKQKQQLEALP